MTRTARLAALALTATMVAGCSLVGGGEQAPSQHTVTLVTHDSWAVDKTLWADFQKTSGITVKVSMNGDAGALTNKLVLTKANPIGDIAYGVDSTFASRAVSAGVFAPYTSPDASQGPQRYQFDDSHRLTAIDVGDVCLNVDTGWYAAHNRPAPSGYADLTDPKYKGQTVVEDPSTSSPGLAFLLGTIKQFGADNWPDYWSKLKANDVKVDSGWDEAYSQDFSGSSGKGPRPIVVSYASSPADEIGDDGKPRTKALLNTCYRQVEYAGVLAGAKNPDDAKKVLDFLISQKFQEQVPGSMYVYPSRSGVSLPAAWKTAAPLPDAPAQLPADQVDANREKWVQQCRTLLQG
ncbi:thiamine transport system substrate-binding protein [Kutzneria kofuensis]|uniref:Thiamine transport system substrate-binding protein n=2 Tax=Kutzneria kofuensis TaxID=103725 RepID=A0A7W9KFM9_9PSEU|nr:thiamine transport system substrate-binding protein [Kutzneria kofuensis]